MKKRSLLRTAALAAALSLLLSLLSACSGGELEATAMRLKRTEGTVGVSDGEGKSLKPAEDLGLYGGYRVDTQGASYAWIDLDEVKLTKMDENSGITIQKEGKHLAIQVQSGSLFFNVTQPLAEDETLDIRTSTMLVGIRGTCGWVRGYESGGWMELYLLEGTVECSVGGNTATVTAGEMASMAEDGDIVVVPFPESSVPAFVLDEVREDEALAAAVKEASGLDLGSREPQAAQPSGGEDAAPEESYEIDGTLELAEGTTRLKNEEIYQDVVVRDGQSLECEGTTIYGSVRVEYGGMVTLSRESTIRGSVYVEYVGHISLRGESTIRGEIHIDGGGVTLVNSTVEGDVYANDTRLDNGNIAGSGSFHMTGSRAAKNIYIGGATALLFKSTVDGYIDVNNSEDYRINGNAYGLAELDQCTVNGQWYEKAAVVYEIRENENVWYNGDDVTVIMGRTP